MNGTQRFDYLVPTSIFLRNKEYERHQKKLEEIKVQSKNKGIYYNRQHMEGIRVHNNIKVNNNKFKDKLKNDELQESNNKILKKIIEISKIDNGISKQNVDLYKIYTKQEQQQLRNQFYINIKMTQLSPRRMNFEEVDKIIRENQILSSKINNVDSQWNNKKIASQYQMLYECKKRIQRFEVVDYEKNQVKLKALELANSTFNAGISSINSRLSQRKGSLNYKNNGIGEDTQEHGEYGSYFDENSSQTENDTQNYYLNINSTNSKNQVTPRGSMFDQGRAKSCERERTSLYRNQQNCQIRQESKTRDGSTQQNSNNRAHRQIGTCEDKKQRSVSRGHAINTISNPSEQSKTINEADLQQKRYFRNYKKAPPGRQSLNISLNSINTAKASINDDQSLKQTGGQQFQNNKNRGQYNNQSYDGQFYNEEFEKNEEIDDDVQGYNPSGGKQQQIARYNQNFIENNTRESQSNEKQPNKTNNKQNQDKINLNSNNQSRIQSAKPNNKDFISMNMRQVTPNRNNIIHSSQQRSDIQSAKSTPRNNNLQQSRKLDQTLKSQTNNNNSQENVNGKSLLNSQKDSSNKFQTTISTEKSQNDLQNISNKQKSINNNIKENESQQMKSSKLQKSQKNKTVEDHIIDDSSECQYEQEDDDFVQQESIQIDEDMKKKFTNNSKDFFKDKKKEKFQIAEQDEYEEDFESQLIQSKNIQQNPSSFNNNISEQYQQFNASSQIKNQSKTSQKNQDELIKSDNYQIDQSIQNSSVQNNQSQNIRKQSKRYENDNKDSSQLKVSQTNNESQIQNSKIHSKIDESVQDYDEDNFEPEPEN